MDQDEEEISVLDSQKKDFSQDLVQVLEMTKTMMNNSKDGLQEAIKMILGLEKRARLCGDTKTTIDACKAIVEMCYQAKDWKSLTSNILLLSKRRGQFKMAQQTLVQVCVPYVFDPMEKEAKYELIKALRLVSEGKIFLEVERAKLTAELAKMKEAEGDIPAAAEILQEEQVEAYGGMEKREKLLYLLEEIRLCLLKRDFIRTIIVAKKVTSKLLSDPEVEDLKIRYYRYLSLYHTHERDTFELAQCALNIFRCPSINESETLWIPELQSAIILLAASPYDNTQVDLVHKLLEFDKDKLNKVPAYKALLELLVGKEVCPWPLPNIDELSKHPLLRGGSLPASTEKFTLPPSPDLAGIPWLQMLRDQTVEHSIRVISGYYTRIHTSRLAGFLQLTPDETEQTISRLYSSSKVPLYAKIDRPSGIISFAPKKDSNDRLSDWTNNISDLLSIVEKTCHQIHKETMMHNLKQSNLEDN